jgi:dihydroflavonol-4-reductase
MRALVTGSNGFIGSTLVEALLNNKYKVRCLVRKTSNLQWLEGLDIELVYGDLIQVETLASAVRDMDYIFHLGGVTKAANYEGYVNGNYQTTCNLLDACKHANKSLEFIFISSQAAGGPGTTDSPRDEFQRPEPISIYGQTKLMAEKAVLDYAEYFPVTIIRPPSVYGPKDKDVFVLFQNVSKGIIPVLHGGKQKVSMIHVDDLISGILLVAGNKAANENIYYMSGNEQLEWGEIGKVMAKALDKKAVQVSVPVFLLDTISWISPLYSKFAKKAVLLNRDKVREMKEPSWLCSNERAKKELNFQPKIKLLDGFRQTAEWYKQNGWL